FHERADSDTLFRLAGNRYAQGQANTLRRRADELTAAMRAAEGREQRRLAQELESVTAALLDIEEFVKRIEAVTHATDERGERAGWKPERDDGILLNLAPLHTLIPAWSAEP